VSKRGSRCDAIGDKLANVESRTASDAKEVITVDELAALLRVDRKSAYQLVAKGQVPGIRRIGRAIRIHRATVLAWLATGLASSGSAQ